MRNTDHIPRASLYDQIETSVQHLTQSRESFKTFSSTAMLISLDIHEQIQSAPMVCVSESQCLESYTMCTDQNRFINPFETMAWRCRCCRISYNSKAFVTSLQCQRLCLCFRIIHRQCFDERWILNRVVHLETPILI